MIKNFQRSFFIGREQEKGEYHHFLKNSRPWILLVTGMPGIGKSTFLQHVEQHDTPTDAITVRLDFADISLRIDRLKVLEELSRGTERCCSEQAVVAFRQKVEEARLYFVQQQGKHLKNLADQLQQQDRVIPEDVEKMLCDVPMQETASQEAVEKLFYEQMKSFSHDKQLVIMFDTCEWLDSPSGQRVKSWLENELIAKLPEAKQCHIVIAGRMPMQLSTVNSQDHLEMKLEGLDETAVTNYMQNEMKMQNEAGKRVFRMTRGHPLCLSILCALWREERENNISKEEEKDLILLEREYDEQQFIELVQERLDSRLYSPYREWTHYGVLLRSFDLPLLCAVFSEIVNLPDYEDCYHQFIRYAYVVHEREKSECYMIHELLREVLVENIRQQEPDKWRTYHQRAFNYYQKCPVPQQYNMYYHAVALDAEKGIKDWKKAVRGALQRNEQHFEYLLYALCDNALKLSDYPNALYNEILRESKLRWGQNKDLEKYTRSESHYKEAGNYARVNSAKKAIRAIKWNRRKQNFTFIITAVMLILTVVIVLPSVVLKWVFPLGLVTTLADSGPGSLRQAINSVQFDNAGNRITFSPQLRGTIVLTSGDLEINTNVTVVGNGNITISNGGNKNTHIHIMSNSIVSFMKLSFKDSLVLRHSFIYNDGGSVTLNDCHLEGNESYDDGGVITNSNGMLSIINSTITQNFSSSSGGGIYNYNGILAIKNSEVSHNIAFDNGGAIHSLLGTVNLDNINVVGNKVFHSAQSQGGGIAILNAMLNITNSAIKGNQTPGVGGGLAVLGSQVTLSNSIITGNQAGQRGGGLAVEIDSENGKSGLVILANACSNPTPNCIADNRAHLDSDIMGQQSPSGTSGYMRIVSLYATVIGDPAPRGLVPDFSSNYLGNINLDRYCKNKDENKNQAYASSGATNSEHLYCVNGASKRVPVLPLAICKAQYSNVVTARLADYYDMTSWQCYTNVRFKGYIAAGDKIDRFCKSLGYMGLAKTPIQTAYDWGCAHPGVPGIHPSAFVVGFSVTDACAFTYNMKNMMDRLGSYEKPRSWECWMLLP